jgi:hypothetical protein
MPGRSVIHVYEIIKKVIPDDRTELKNDLDKYIYSLYNIAPENLSNRYYWLPFIKILNFHIVKIKEPWQIAIQQILLTPLDNYTF